MDDFDMDRILEEINHNYNYGICIHCGADIMEERQVGRCVYALPCGCRAGQGKARTAEQLAECKEKKT